jgi:hypothetical protein
MRDEKCSEPNEIAGTLPFVICFCTLVVVDGVVVLLCLGANPEISCLCEIMRDANQVNIPRKNLVVLYSLIGMSLLGALVAQAQSGMKISGRIFDVTQGVIPRATVSLFSVDQLRETRSDDDGRFELTNLPPGVYEIQVKMPGFKTRTIENVQISDKDAGLFTITLEGLPTESGCGNEPPPSYENARTDKVSLVGTAREYSGTILADARLELVKSGMTNVTTSNDSGLFRFVDIEPGKYVLSVTHPGYFQLSTINLWVMRDNLTRVTFVMLRQGYVIECLSGQELLDPPPLELLDVPPQDTILLK